MSEGELASSGRALFFNPQFRGLLGGLVLKVVRDPRHMGRRAIFRANAVLPSVRHGTAAFRRRACCARPPRSPYRYHDGRASKNTKVRAPCW